MKLKTIIRLLVTGGLIYPIYGETGIFTALGFSLVALSIEMLLLKNGD